MLVGYTRIFLLFFFQILLSAVLRAGCVDSVHIKVIPVQCNGLRNGVIEIIEIFGGEAPFYFSIDGQTYSTRPIFDLLWAGEYSIFVRDASGCVQEYQILVPEPPEFKVDISITDTSIVAGEWIQMRATVSPAGSTLTAIEWRPPNLFILQNQLLQTVRVSEDTDFAVEVRNTNGCVARDNLFVPVAKTNLYFPNVFAPNSNQNNFFTLFAGEGVARVVRLQVYDRGGNLVFEKHDFLPNDPLKGWNGKWHGRPAPTGVYPWVAQVEFLNGNQRQFAGNVTLIGE